MMLFPRREFHTPAKFQGTSVLGTTQDFEIPTTLPVEEIFVVVGATVGTALSSLTIDNILAIVKNVTLDINDGIAPRSVVNYSGPGLLEYASQVGVNLDRSTLGAVSLSQGSTVAVNMSFRICYRIPLVHPQITEPLRTRMLLPVHTWKQSPKLSLTFASATEISAAGALSALAVEVVIKRRVMPDNLTAAILADGGFIPSDLVETQNSVPLSTAGEQRFIIPSPGQYTGILFRQYLGGASYTRYPIDQVLAIGQESRWRIESGLQVKTEWRWKYMQVENDFTRTANHTTQTYSPNFSGVVSGSTMWQPASSTFLDYLTDGIDSANELGSLLDANTPVNSGLKLEVIGACASVATNASLLYIGGHRLFGDLSRWQVVRGK